MNHKTVQKKLLLYLDSDLSDNEEQLLKIHLANCQDCQKVLYQYQKIWRTDKPVNRITAPSVLWKRISTQLEKEQQKNVFFPFYNSFFPALRAVAIVLSISLSILGGIRLGNLIILSQPDQTEIPTDKQDNFGMDYFNTLPPGTISGL
jgi:hypothetical protein